MTIVLGALIGAPVGAGVLANRMVLLAMLQLAAAAAISDLHILRRGRHARILPRPRPLRILTHGDHETTATTKTAITKEIPAT